MSLVGKLGCLPCHHVHSLHKKKKKKKKKKKALKKVEVFLDKVKSSVPGAEEQLLRQRHVNVKLDYMYNFLIKKENTLLPNTASLDCIHKTLFSTKFSAQDHQDFFLRRKIEHSHAMENHQL